MPNFTKKVIERAFLKLLNERPLNKITVKDIVDVCGMNRNSFYYHYDDIPSLIRHWLSDESKKLLEQYSTKNSSEENLGLAMSFILENKRAFLHIYNSVNRDIFEQGLWDACKFCAEARFDRRYQGVRVSDKVKNLLIEYYKFMFFGMISAWFSKGLEESAVEEYKKIIEMCESVSIDKLSSV